jgi:predicted small secreted protein
MKNLIGLAKHFEGESDQARLDTLKASFDNFQNLKASYVVMQKRLQSLAP